MHLSIIIPTYNTGQPLADCLASALGEIDTAAAATPGTQCECIVVDDCSTDPDALALLDGIERMDPRIRLIRAAENRGPAGARNLGIAAADGEWIGFLDADDLWYPGALTGMLSAAIETAGAEWLVGRIADWTPPDVPVLRPPLFEATGPATPVRVEGLALRRELARPPRLLLGAMLVKRAVIARNGALPASMLCGEDWYWMLLLARNTAMDYLDLPFLKLRRHPESLTASGRTHNWRAFSATLKAIARPDCSGVRRELRWTLLTQVKYVAAQQHQAGHRRRAAAYQLLASLIAVNEAAEYRRILDYIR
ncbi:MAG: glycosyltransferase family 2 protein [Gammaproteobacteria bacterium]|nr:glycosyltransferase family 2 protein [Gammaproteobacteria bacterium]